MKKIISVFASLLVLICFFSCSNPSVPSVPVNTSEPTETSDTPELVETSESVEVPERVEPTLPKVPVEETYTVWTFTMPYSDFQDKTKIPLEDNTFFSWPWTPEKTEETEIEWAKFLLKYKELGILTDEGMHQWTRSKIKDWFIGHSFVKDDADTMTAWLITEKHVIVLVRCGNWAYGIVK